MKKILLLLLLVSSTVVASVVWQRTSRMSSPTYSWPTSLPACGNGSTVFALDNDKGNAFVHQLVNADPQTALAEVCAAYRRAGWHMAPIQTPDMRLFTHGEIGVAAVFVADTPTGTRLTLVQRKHRQLNTLVVN